MELYLGHVNYKVHPEDECILYSDGSLGINLSNPKTINNIMLRLDESKKLADEIDQRNQKKQGLKNDR